MHKTLNNEELIYEITKYDYGIHPAHEMSSRYKRDDLLSNEKYIYLATNKYFDYLAADIPIIGGTLERQLDELESGWFVLRRPIEEIDFNELREKKLYLRQFWRIEQGGL